MRRPWVIDRAFLIPKSLFVETDFVDRFSDITEGEVLIFLVNASRNLWPPDTIQQVDRADIDLPIVKVRIQQRHLCIQIIPVKPDAIARHDRAGFGVSIVLFSSMLSHVLNALLLCITKSDG